MTNPSLSASHRSEPGILTFFLTEMAIQLRSKATWVCFAIMALMFYRYVSGSEWDELVGSGRVPVNAPIVFYYIFAFSTYWTMIFATFLATGPIVRDLRHSVAPVLYAYPFKDYKFFLGKYLATMVTLILVMSGVFLGFVLLSITKPSLNEGSLHTYMPMAWSHAFHSFAILVIPGCIFFGTAQYVLGALTGRMTLSYTFSIVATLIFITFEMSFQADTHTKFWPQVLDPVGYITLQGQVFYWTADERIARYISLEGPMLWNRLFYLALAAVILIAGVFSFNLRNLLARRASKAQPKTRDTGVENSKQKLTPASLAASRRSPPLLEALVFGWAEFRRVLREPWFLLVNFAGFITAFMVALRMGGFYSLPEGDLLSAGIAVLSESVDMYIVVGLIAVAFATGEILGRERASKVGVLVDSTPATNGLLIASKLIACMLVTIALTFVPFLATLLVQIIDGYGANIEWNLHFIFYAVSVLPSLMTFMAISAAIHIIVNHRATGHALATIACFSVLMMSEIEVVEHPLLLPGEVILPPPTAFDALAQFVQRQLFVNGYYLALGAGLIALAALLWPRGAETKLSSRIASAPARLSLSHLVCIAATVGGAGFLAAHVAKTLNRNNFQTIAQEKADDAEYEKRYSGLQNEAYPRVAGARLHIDLNPQERSARLASELRLSNDTADSIDRLLVRAADFSKIECLKVGAACAPLEELDEDYNQYAFSLPKAMSPGEEQKVTIEQSVAYRGFVDEGYHGTIVADGTFLKQEFWPAFGYDTSRELPFSGDRRFFNLPGRQRPPAPENAGAAHFPQDTPFATYLPIEIEITTAPGHVAVAPGDLIDYSLKDERPVFRYSMPHDARWRFAVADAKYEVVKKVFTGADHNVTIEIYHLPQHSMNAERFADAAIASLQTLTKTFGPYPYDVLRIIETPQDIIEHPETNANLLAIPERDGWLHDYRTLPARDWILSVVAEGIAKTWMSDELASADAGGANLISRSTPAYFSMRVLETVRGKEAALDLLNSRRDLYLRRRVKEDGQEESVITAAFPGFEDYIVHKGLLNLVSAGEILGADRLDAAIGQFFQTMKSRRKAPFATTMDLLSFIEDAAASENERTQVRDAFLKPQFYDFRIESAVRKPDGAVEIALGISNDADDQSVNTITEAADLQIPVAFYDSPGATQPLAMSDITAPLGQSTITIPAPQNALRIMIDPYGRYIDANPRDNVKMIR